MLVSTDAIATIPDRTKAQKLVGKTIERQRLSHKSRRAQWVGATLACSLAAGVLNPKVSRGL
jgi:hypothetical protein